MDKRFFYVRLFGAQILAFLVSVALNQFIFLKGTPIVRADVPTRIASIPNTVFNSVSRIQKTTSESKSSSSQQGAPIVINSTPAPTLQASQNITQSPTSVPTSQPTQIPTSTPLPTTRPTTVQSQPTTAPTTQPTSALPSSGSNSTLEQQTIDIINQRRSSQGLSTLSSNAQLTTAARRHSTDLNNTGQCGHIGSDGSDPSRRVREAGYTSFSNIGETVGCQQPNPQALVDAWWASSGHHAILVTPGFKFIGMGWVGSYQTAVLVQ